MDDIQALFAAAEERAAETSRANNACKCQERLEGLFARRLQVIPAKGNYDLYTLVGRPQKIQAVQDLLCVPADGDLVVAPVRVLRSGRGANWIACCEPPAKCPTDGSVVVSVAIGGRLVRIVPEADFIKFWKS